MLLWARDCFGSVCMYHASVNGVIYNYYNNISNYYNNISNYYNNI